VEKRKKNYKFLIIIISMRTKILVLSAALALSANLHAQVSIGDLTAPATGALLDLNKTVKGGLALSNVKIEHLYEIPDNFPGITKPVSNQIKQDFTGAIVYHTGENNIQAGVYVWNGTNWTPADENCLPLTSDKLKLTLPPFAQTGDIVPIAVSLDVSARCSGGETYAWYKNTGGTSDYETPAFATDTVTTTSFSITGTYKVKVEVTNNCYTDPATTPVVKETSIRIVNCNLVTLTAGNFTSVVPTSWPVNNNSILIAQHSPGTDSDYGFGGFDGPVYSIEGMYGRKSNSAVIAFPGSTISNLGGGYGNPGFTANTFPASNIQVTPTLIDAYGGDGNIDITVTNTQVLIPSRNISYDRQCDKSIIGFLGTNITDDTGTGLVPLAGGFHQLFPGNYTFIDSYVTWHYKQYIGYYIIVEF
jgi:hypothetical protein